MNAIVSNKNKALLESLDIDVIKTINGEFSTDEIISAFSNFFFNRMFLDITAVKDYYDISNIQKLSMNIEMDKVIVLLTDSLMNDKNYLSKLISMGIFNFAKDKESLMYLYNHPNTYKDVAHIHQLDNTTNENEAIPEKKYRFFRREEPEEYEPQFQSSRSARVIGFKNVTKEAGATTLIYMIKKVLSQKDYVVAIEVNKNDFGFFNEKDMYSVNQDNLSAAINKFANANMILIDLNNSVNLSLCDEIIYLVEPSTIKLNKLMLIDKETFNKLSGKKIVLNKSLLNEKDVNDFKFESHTNIAYNLQPLNERIDNTEKIKDLVNKLEL